MHCLVYGLVEGVILAPTHHQLASKVSQVGCRATHCEFHVHRRLPLPCHVHCRHGRACLGHLGALHVEPWLELLGHGVGVPRAAFGQSLLPDASLAAAHLCES